MSVHVLGSCNIDVVCRVASLPRPGETVAASAMERLAGGKGANQAIAASRFGVATRLIGCVGTDALGDLMLENLKADGVDTQAMLRVAEDTGTALVTVDERGENQIVVAAGANALVRFDEATLQHEDGAVCLAQLEVPLTAVHAFLARGRGLGMKTVLNTAPAVIEASEVFPLCDIVVFNQTELASYSGCAQGADDAEVIAAARSLLSCADQTLIVTLGKDGAVAVGAHGVLRQPGMAARVVDTTGAGDIFCGVLAACLSRGAAVAEAMRLACTAAAIAVERPGAASSAPRREEVLVRA